MSDDPQGPGAHPPAAGTVPASAGEPSGLQRPVPVVVLMVGAVLGLVLGLGVAAALGGDDESAAVAPTDSSTTSSAPTSTTTTTASLAEPTTTSTTEAPPPATGGRDTPVEVGTPFEIGAARVTVTNIDLDAESWLVDLHDLNNPPEPGWRYVIVHRTVENIGDDGFDPLTYPLARAVGSEDFSSSCLDLYDWPDRLGDEPTIYPGGIAQGTTCLHVPADEIDNGTFLIELSALPDRVYVTP